MDWDFLLINIALPVVLGVVASQVFSVLVAFRKPRVTISPVMTWSVDAKTGKRRLRAKVVNKTRAPLVDLHAQLHILYKQPGTTYNRAVQVQLRRSNPLLIDGYSRRDDQHGYAYRFASLDYDEVLENHPHIPEDHQLRLRFTCRHATTGVVRVFSQRFSRDSLIEGDFLEGDSFEVHGAGPRGSTD